MIKEIEARTLLAHVKQPDPWFGLKYNMNLYRGCQHRCIYCDSRSECYGIEDFDGEVLVKANAVELLRRELATKRVKGTIGTGSMNDPYMPAEAKIGLTGRALAVIAEAGFPVHVLTKSALVQRDLPVLQQINRALAVVSFTVTTADDALARKIEPGASPPSERFKAMETLARAGISTGVLLMPVLPFIEDTEENIAAIVQQTARHGGTYILPMFGLTLRDRQRAYFYRKLDELFPGLRPRYQAQFGPAYGCTVPQADALYRLFNRLCADYGLATRVPRYQPLPATSQLSLF